jgi:hypothetical protein
MTSARALSLAALLGACATTLTAAPGAPVIDNAPADQTVTPPAAAVFTVVAHGEGPLHYAWSRNDLPFGGDSPAITTGPTDTTQDGDRYAVEVSNAAGHVRTAAAILHVVTGPLPAPRIDAQPRSVSVSAGGTATLDVVAEGGAPLRYQWAKDGQTMTGVTAPVLVLFGVQPSNGGVYTVSVANASGSVVSAPATLTVVDGPVAPAIVHAPAATTVTTGTPVTLAVQATGTAPLAYQWFKDGAALAGANAAGYTIAAASPADAGAYSVRVSNGAGSITSATAELTVVAQATPPTIAIGPQSLAVAAGANATFTVIANGTAPFAYQWSHDSVAIPGATGAMLTIASAQIVDGGFYSVVVSNSAGSTTALPARLEVTPAAIAPTLTQQPTDLTVGIGSFASFTVVAAGTPPLAYQWRKDGVDVAGATTPALVIASAQIADAGAYTVVVANSAGSVTSGPALLSVENVATAPVVLVDPADTTAAVGAPVSFTVLAAGSEPLSYQWLKDGLEIGGATMATLTITSVLDSDAGSYACVVSNSAGTATSVAAQLTILAPLVAPEITQQPSDQTVAAGAAVSFTVVAGGTAPLSYQWRKDGVALDGATAATLTIPAVQPADAGGYSCVVTNGVGSVVSLEATLTITAAGIRPYRGPTSQLRFIDLQLLGSDQVTKLCLFGADGVPQPYAVLTSLSEGADAPLVTVPAAYQTVPGFTTLVVAAYTGSGLDASPDGCHLADAVPLPSPQALFFDHQTLVVTRGGAASCDSSSQSLCSFYPRPPDSPPTGTCPAGGLYLLEDSSTDGGYRVVNLTRNAAEIDLGHGGYANLSISSPSIAYEPPPSATALDVCPTYEYCYGVTPASDPCQPEGDPSWFIASIPYPFSMTQAVSLYVIGAAPPLASDGSRMVQEENGVVVVVAHDVHD